MTSTMKWLTILFMVVAIPAAMAGPTIIPSYLYKDPLTITGSLVVDNITVNGATVTSDTGAISFDNENLSTTGTLYVPSIIGGTATTSDLSIQTTSASGASGADMHFLVGNDGATEAMTILNDGKVGIGTASPSSKLHVVGDIEINNSGFIGSQQSAHLAAADGGIVISTVTIGNQAEYDGATNRGAEIRFEQSNFSGGLGGEISFWNHLENSYLTKEQMRISSTNNVGIGTTDFDGTPPVGRLTVKGTTNDGTTNIFVGRDSAEANVVTIDSDGNITTTGTLTARFKTVEKTTDASLTAAECSDTLVTNRGWDGNADMTLTLPDADTSVGDGLKFKFLVAVTDAAEDIYIDPEGSTTKIYLDGVASTDGYRIWTQEPTIGEGIVCHTATLDGTTYDWFCDSINGVWEDKGS